MFSVKNTTKSNCFAIENTERSFRIDFTPVEEEGYIRIGRTRLLFSALDLQHMLDESPYIGEGARLTCSDGYGGQTYMSFRCPLPTVKNVFGIIDTPAGDMLIISDEEVRVLREFFEEAIRRTNGPFEADEGSLAEWLDGLTEEDVLGQLVTDVWSNYCAYAEATGRTPSDTPNFIQLVKAKFGLRVVKRMIYGGTFLAYARR